MSSDMKRTFVLLSVLLVVSSCPDGWFNCKPGCVPASYVCDFKTDCDNGSDEEFCGSCNFESHSCGWNNTSGVSYRWKRQMANITSVPGMDHTMGIPWGHVMHIDGKNEGYSPAKIEYSVDKLAALGCQISFWYHIYDNISSSSSSSLKLTMMVRGTTDKDLMDISKSNTNGWEKATVFIGNQPGGYKLQLSFKPPILNARSVMLDDISFENCAEGDVPTGSDKLTCDFEIDTCSWYPDHTTGLLWKRTDGRFDGGPVGNGYYMLITASSKINISSTARLVSFPQPKGQVLCVSFRYNIFGNSIGSLKFITKRSGENEMVAWMRSGTQGNKWRLADLTFSSEKPIQFIIEAVVGGTQGRIAIDDLKVNVSETGSCPAERECTFQGSMCGLLPHLATDFNWQRITGESQPANSTDPITDHTLGTDQGYYLSAQLWRHPVGSRGAVMTAWMEPTTPDGECLMFWYYMEGSDVGKLSVYLNTSNKYGHTVQLWSRQGDQGKHWRHGRVTLSSTTTYQVIFEVVAADGPRRAVAIDDIMVLNGHCPPTGFCDFEMDFCGWVNNPPAESGVDWDWLSGQSVGDLVPPKDHSTHSAMGHFAYFIGYKSNPEEIAQLESETMGAVDQACLEMWHYVEGWLGEGSSGLTLAVLINETAGLHNIWNTKGWRKNTWLKNRIDYNASGPHQIILQAMYSGILEESISVDDIHIIRNKPCNEIIPPTTSGPTTATATTIAPTLMDCTFEHGLCSWVQDDNDDLNWTLSTGFQVDEPWNGPQYDHTIGNNQGFFLLLNGSGQKDGERAIISFPVPVHLSSQICVGFWYHMLGPSVSNLDLVVATKFSEELVWTRQGTQNPKWINAQVTISMNDTIWLILAGHRNTSSKGFIAIDDITVKEGPCSNQNFCGFDSNLCDFENNVGLEGHWVREKGTKNQVDHTYGTENGFYMTVMIPDSKQTEAQLLTPQLNSDEELCVRFWYLIPTGLSELSVHVLRSGELADALWKSSGAPSSDWEVAEVTVSSPAKFRVVFKAVIFPGTYSSVRLDDISMRDGACSPPASCDFESGQCTWVNKHKEHGHDWVLARGGFQGPPIDHTTQTAEGWFLLSSSPNQNHSSHAILLSEWIHLRNITSCLTLWYHMDSSNSSTLRVYLLSALSDEDLIFNTNSSGHSWTGFSQSVQKANPFRLVIKAETNNRGFIAVDDISLTPGVCQANETSLQFEGCTFENDTCGWKDISIGQGQWMRGRNASDDNGPSTDNTLGTELGWYMAVNPLQGDLMSPATVQSATMKQASATCTLHFYYNMYGDDAGELNVVLKEGSRTTVLWWLSGSHGPSWHHGVVMVSRMPQDFTILFEASRTFTKPGHIAIDDIYFTNCTLPEPQPFCPENMFLCNNSVCVEHSQVCDFSDDCGDWSDENICASQSLQRCSFEQGLCSWEGSDVDTPEVEWTPVRGLEAWPKYGPPRDHTLNSAAGHFVIPGILTEKGQISEILSNTLLPSSNCTVQFYFFSLDDDAAALTVRSRKLRSGHEDSVLWLKENSTSYSWQRAQVMFSSSNNIKIVFRYERRDGSRGLVALDDISFSRECVLDQENNQLPQTSSTSAPSTSSNAPTSQTTPLTSTAPTDPCQDDEFFCWRSIGKVCILATSQCDYHPDCPQGEDEDGCGPCTFDRNQCRWTDTSDGQSKWQRQKASNSTEPPIDHTTGKGYYISVRLSQRSAQSSAVLQSPPLPPSSPYCQIQFHFHISSESAGSVRVLMQQAEESEAILWSRNHSTVSHWIPEQLPVGLHQQTYWVQFSSLAGSHVALDDISFLNCEESYQPPAPSACNCSFEDGLCVWVRGAENELNWLSSSGPTETSNTGPAGDHTTSKGKYLYVKSLLPSMRGYKAQLKSPLLPPAGENGYCFTFWQHMFGSSVGSLSVILQTTDPLNKIQVWQKSGNQGEEGQLVQIHVTLQKVHQVILEATVGGETSEIAIDEITFFDRPCLASKSLSVGLIVGLTLLAGVIISIFLFMMNKMGFTVSCPGNHQALLKNDGNDQNAMFDLFDYKTDGTKHEDETVFSFHNNYNTSARVFDGTMASSEA